MFWNLVNPGYGPIALNEGVGDIITSIFADGTDGFYFNFSELDKLFTGSQGPTNVAVATDAIGLALDQRTWGGKTLAEVLAAQPELVTNGTFAGGAAGWTDASTGGASISFSGGQATTVVPSGTAILTQAIACVVGQTYKVDVNTAAGWGIGTSAGLAQTTGISAGLAKLFVATAAVHYITVSTGTPGRTIDDVSAKLVPGNHGLQATAASQPKWQTGGLARFDGLDDNLLTPLVPGAAMTYMAKVKLVSTNKALMGSSDGTNRSFLSFITGGFIAGGVGSQSTATIKGNVNHTGQTGVVALTHDGSTVKLLWNATEEYSAAQSGTGANAVTIPIGGISSSGVVGSFADHDFYHALAIKKALSAAEIAAITTLWGTT